MKIIVEVNLSAAWVKYLHDKGHEAVHWSSVGDHVVRALTIGAIDIELGAVVTIKSSRMRISKLPIGTTEPR